MLLHRPHPLFYGNHVTLYFEGFDVFCKLVNTVEISTDDTEFVMKLVIKMGKHYDHEDRCRDAFLDIMNYYISPLRIIRTAVPYTRFYPDGCISLDFNGEVVVTLIVEVKNEVGKGSADSLMEAVGYYFHFNLPQRQKVKVNL